MQHVKDTTALNTQKFHFVTKHKRNAVISPYTVLTTEWTIYGTLTVISYYFHLKNPYLFQRHQADPTTFDVLSRKPHILFRQVLDIL